MKDILIIGAATAAGVMFGGKLETILNNTIKPDPGSAMATVTKHGAPVAVGIGVGWALKSLIK